ncbi:unnamed protein product [Mucor hiemalis]
MSYDTNSTNLLTLNNEPFPSTQQPTSSPDAKQISKLILDSALQKANAAVQCDSTNDVLVQLMPTKKPSCCWNVSCLRLTRKTIDVVYKKFMTLIQKELDY